MAGSPVLIYSLKSGAGRSGVRAYNTFVYELDHLAVCASTVYLCRLFRIVRFIFFYYCWLHVDDFMFDIRYAVVALLPHFLASHYSAHFDSVCRAERAERLL